MILSSEHLSTCLSTVCTDDDVAHNLGWLAHIPVRYRSVVPYRYHYNSVILNEMQTKVKSELNEILRASNVNVDEPDLNPISRVPVIVIGDEGTVLIQVIE